MRKLFLSIFLFVVTSFLSAGTVVEEIVARVGNEIITKRELDEQYERLREELARRMKGEELEKRFAEQKGVLLEMMVNQKLLEQRAKEMDISVDEEVDAAIKRLREENNIPDDAALEKALRSEGSSMAELRSDFRKRIIQQKVLWNYVQGKVNITEEEIKNYYEKNKGTIMSETITKVKRYSIAEAQTPKETLQAEAQTVLTDLRAGKELKQGDYPHLIVSEEETELSASELDPKFVQILDATAVGSFTDPLEGANSFMILKVIDRKPPKQIPLEEARGRIYNILLEERAEKYQKTFLEDLRKQNYVVINQPS